MMGFRKKKKLDIDTVSPEQVKEWLEKVRAEPPEVERSILLGPLDYEPTPGKVVAYIDEDRNIVFTKPKEETVLELYEKLADYWSKLDFTEGKKKESAKKAKKG